VAGIHPREGLQLIKDMSLDKTFKNNIDVGLKSVLPSMLPSDITERANGKLHVCVTKLWPSPSGSIISKFDNVEDIIDTVAASCFIPFYSSPKALFTKITSRSPSEYYIDGGVFGFMPSIGDVRCSPFPTRMLRRSPNIFIKSSVFSTPRLMSWVLSPAPPDVLEEMYKVILCICRHIFMCLYVYMDVYIFMYVFISICRYLFMYVSIYVCGCIYIYIYT
jgi:hypothetical protein